MVLASQDFAHEQCEMEKVGPQKSFLRGCLQYKK